MDKKQTGELLKEIDNLYPRKIDLTPKTLEAWHRYMESQEFERVMARLDAYVISNQFPPTVADLYEKPRVEHQKVDMSKYDQWEREASGPPPKRQR